MPKLSYSIDKLHMEFRFVPPGVFVMGSISGDPDRNEDEVPHEVEITNTLYCQTSPVTIKQYRRFISDTGYSTGSDIEYWELDWKQGKTFDEVNCYGDNYPVVGVSFLDALSFIGWLSSLDGHPYRLLTEAEFEYVSRARCDCVAQCKAVSQCPKERFRMFPEESRKPSSVQTMPPNDFGIYDMNSLIWQWCADWYAPYSSNNCRNPEGPQSKPEKTYWRGRMLSGGRVIRGGSFSYPESYSRCSNRHYSFEEDRNFNVGFRICRTVD